MEEIMCEVEALKAIYEEEIAVDESAGVVTITKKIRPTDAEDISSASILTAFSLREGYPSMPPEITISHPRGISEEAYSRIQQEVQNRVKELDGLPVVFDVIQLCEEFLLKNQHSDAQLCPICLCNLAGASVSCTPCDHYVHSTCLEAHREHSQRQLGEILKKTPFDMKKDVDATLLCPVCRMIIEEDIEPLDTEDVRKRRSTRVQRMDDFDFNWDSWRLQLANLQLLMEKQRSQGGIIDLEEERKRNLVTEETVVVLSVESMPPAQEPASNDCRPAVSSKGMHHRRKPRGAGHSNATRDPLRTEHGEANHISSKPGRGKFSGKHYSHNGSRGRGPRNYGKPKVQQESTSDISNS